MPLTIATHKLVSLLDENRLALLAEVFYCSDSLCGCDLTEKLSIPKNLLSYHIKSLREAGYLQETRCGRRKQYRISPEKMEKVKAILTVLEVYR